MEKHPSPSTKPITQPRVISLSCWFSALDGLSPTIRTIVRRVPPDTPGFPAYSRMRTAPLPARGAAFSYLRTVIVTAAVYRGFNSGLSALLLTFRHRAGVSPCTSPFGFAETCVFSKQSVGPLSCDLQTLRMQDPTRPEAPLLPKLR